MAENKSFNEFMCEGAAEANKFLYDKFQSAKGIDDVEKIRQELIDNEEFSESIIDYFYKTRKIKVMKNRENTSNNKSFTGDPMPKKQRTDRNTW